MVFTAFELTPADQQGDRPWGAGWRRAGETSTGKVGRGGEELDVAVQPSRSSSVRGTGRRPPRVVTLSGHPTREADSSTPGPPPRRTGADRTVL
ncbi:hypothetical protein STRTUCAR8_09040 [Streptomyces turgidiscabies Car8]|uniref:Uncharacterized protein n=1 Tax=Streptomyces turgidiscabies (strain Car8) TaxID=698760 RepID=L7FBK0_STRT8|nr:hypothetical protein STRTUCAR8_09040 [Streptomyces turgidiscabies Car8]